eukprot:Clim_evm16s251 gene=Clim_evmTU16s251
MRSAVKSGRISPPDKGESGTSSPRPSRSSLTSASGQITISRSVDHSATQEVKIVIPDDPGYRLQLGLRTKEDGSVVSRAHPLTLALRRWAYDGEAVRCLVIMPYPLNEIFAERSAAGDTKIVKHHHTFREIYSTMHFEHRIHDVDVTHENAEITKPTQAQSPAGSLPMGQLTSPRGTRRNVGQTLSPSAASLESRTSQDSLAENAFGEATAVSASFTHMNHEGSEENWFICPNGDIVHEVVFIMPQMARRDVCTLDLTIALDPNEKALETWLHDSRQKRPLSFVMDDTLLLTMYVSLKSNQNLMKLLRPIPLPKVHQSLRDSAEGYSLVFSVQAPNVRDLEHDDPVSEESTRPTTDICLVDARLQIESEKRITRIGDGQEALGTALANTKETSAPKDLLNSGMAFQVAREPKFSEPLFRPLQAGDKYDILMTIFPNSSIVAQYGIASFTAMLYLTYEVHGGAQRITAQYPVSEIDTRSPAFSVSMEQISDATQGCMFQINYVISGRRDMTDISMFIELPKSQQEDGSMETNIMLSHTKSIHLGNWRANTFRNIPIDFVALRGGTYSIPPPKIYDNVRKRYLPIKCNQLFTTIEH